MSLIVRQMPLSKLFIHGMSSVTYPHQFFSKFGIDQLLSSLYQEMLKDSTIAALNLSISLWISARLRVKAVTIFKFLVIIMLSRSRWMAPYILMGECISFLKLHTHKVITLTIQSYFCPHNCDIRRKGCRHLALLSLMTPHIFSDFACKAGNKLCWLPRNTWPRPQQIISILSKGN